MSSWRDLEIFILQFLDLKDKVCAAPFDDKSDLNE